MEEKKEVMLIDEKSIRNKIHVIRGQKVMLDVDLAEIYGYETKNFNRQVKNNMQKFEGDDFMFQLTKEEWEILRCKNFTSRWGGVRYLPYVFTEQGIYMLMTVLHGELATEQSRALVRIFKRMKDYIFDNQDFFQYGDYLKTVQQTMKNMQDIVTIKMDVKAVEKQVFAVQEQLSMFVAKSEQQLEEWRKNNDQMFMEVWNNIEELSANFIFDKDLKEFVIYKNQKFEADVAYIDIYQQANKSIYVVDDYMNAKSLQLLSQKKQGVEVILFTENGHGGKGFLTSSVVKDFNNQYPPLRIKPNPDSHDRWIVLDYGLPTEQVYHCGASSKDAGRKVCAINKLEYIALIHPVIDSLLIGDDKKV